MTSESVTEGHPDKVCDKISDSILDSLLKQDCGSRVAVETVATTGLITVVGEVTTQGYADIPYIVREAVNEIGYNSADMGFDGSTCGVQVSIGQQSPDIAGGVDRALEVREGASSTDLRDVQGAGDQGMVFGYACDETPDLMPAPIWLAHRLSERLAYVRKHEVVEGLRPDGKTMVTVLYDGIKPVAVDNVLVSTQHDPDLHGLVLEDLVSRYVVQPVLEEKAANLDTSNCSLLVNPSGRFVLGGPAADAGLTGRKIIVDTYGGAAPHGGGAFSGKDPSKTDRSAAYGARWIAKNIVAAGLAKRCQVQVAYAIGQARPISVVVDTYGTGEVSDQKLSAAVREVFDLRPLGLIEDLGLLDVRYRDTAAYGHFGRAGFPWEETNRTAALQAAV